MQLMVFNGDKIDEKFYEKFINLYSQIDKNKPFTIELTTRGGSVTWAYMVSNVILKHPENVTVRVPYYAFSSGTLIALAADKIVLSGIGCLGPIDPYMYGINIPTGLKILEDHNRKSRCRFFNPKTLFSGFGMSSVITDYAEKMLKRVNDDHEDFVKNILRAKWEDGEEDRDTVNDIYDFFTNYNHHETPIHFHDIPKDFDLEIDVWDGMLNYIREREELKNKPLAPQYNNNTFPALASAFNPVTLKPNSTSANSTSTNSTSANELDSPESSPLPVQLTPQEKRNEELTDLFEKYKIEAQSQSTEHST